MIESTIRLFRAVPIVSKNETHSNKDFLEQTLSRGFIFTPNVAYNYTEDELYSIIKLVEKELGITPQQMNSTFHKSWAYVRDSSTYELYIQQIIHYFTTYGYDSLGIYDKDTVYIPAEELKIPAIKTESKIAVIKGYTYEELKQKVLNLINSGVALSQQSVDDCFEIIKHTGINEAELLKVKNKEIRTKIYVQAKKVPEDPVEFLRLILYIETSKTLLIKSRALIKQIKTSEKKSSEFFVIYAEKYGLERLAEIFNRFKPLFLALKDSDNASYINKIRKLSKQYHKPMKQDYLNTVTSRLAKGEALDSMIFYNELERVNTFRKIRLAYALYFRLKDVDSIIYKIRNGKSFVKEFTFPKSKYVEEILTVVLGSIISDIRMNVRGKKIYIPENVVYSLPSTEKQFTDTIPLGSYIKIPHDMLLGVHWEDSKEYSYTDLDLALLSQRHGKVGWDSQYKTDSGDIIFSGDLTSAPYGATETFYIRKQPIKPVVMLLTLNHYNRSSYRKDEEIPFKLLIGQGKPYSLEENYTMDPNYLIASTKSTIKCKEKVIGIIVSNLDENRFYFSEMESKSQITSRMNEQTRQRINYLYSFFTDSISLNKILEMAGAVLIEDKEEAEIDLSIEELEKDTLIKLIIGEETKSIIPSTV